MEPSPDATSVVRRRRRMGRPIREKTPDPNFKPFVGRRQRISDDDSSQLEATTASEETSAQTVRMQIRPPGSMSACESKILRRRDKSLVSRSQSQPRQAERLSSPEVTELLRTGKRSLSTPRHKEEGELEKPVEQLPMPTTTAIADENLNRLQQNLQRFEEERKRFEAEKRQFEREKHKLRYKQFHDEERKRLIQNYRKISDRLKLPIDDDERRRLVHSLRLQRPDIVSALPKEPVSQRSNNYDESSTQFSSSDADTEDVHGYRIAKATKSTNPVRRHASAASNYPASPMSRGPPPVVPVRHSVSRNNSLSPIRPHRRSKTPEQRAQIMRRFNGNNEENTTNLITEDEKSPTPPALDDKPIEENLKESIPPPQEEDELKGILITRRGSLPKIVLKQRRPSIESIKDPETKPELNEKPLPAPILKSSKESPSLTLYEKISKYFPSFSSKKKPKERKSPEKSSVDFDPKSSEVPERLLSKKFLREFCSEALFQWRRLKADYPAEVLELRLYRNKCISHTIVLILMCGFGGFIFRYTEGTSENIYKCEVRKVKRDFIDNLWTVSHNMREDDWKSLARQKLRKFEEELYALQELGPRRYPGMKSWNFVNCILYCWTVITTIGYGHITPKTSIGQALTIVYAIIGIPMFLILLADFGKLFTRGMKFLWAYVRRVYYTGTCRKIRKQQQVRDAMSGFNAVYDLAVRRPSHFFNMGPDTDIESQAASEAGGGEKSVGASHPETPTSPYPETFEVDDEFNLPVSVASILLISYILIGAFVYTLWEDWSYFEAFYFVFISMSTIGFGDFVPNHPIFMMCSIIYLVFGLALTSMFINVVQIKLSDTFKHASAKIGATIGFGFASEAGDDVGSHMKTPSELASVHGSRLEKISEDISESSATPTQLPASILRSPRPVSPAQGSSSTAIDGTVSGIEPPPLLPKRQDYVEPPQEVEKKKKKGFFK